MNETTYTPLDAELPDAEPGNEHPYVTEEISGHWIENSRWTYYLAVFGYTMLVFILLAFIYFRTFITFFSGEMLLIGILTLVTTLILARSLHNYSSNIKSAAIASDWLSMESAFSSLRTAYAVYGLAMLCLSMGLLYLLGTAIASSYHYLLESL